MMVHEDYKQMLALQALDALEGADVRELDAHLATCAECRTELDEMRDASSLMAYASNQLEPSAGLRSRILESVATQNSSSRMSAATPGVEPAPRTNVIPLARPKRRQWNLGQSFGAIAAALVLAASIVGLFVLWNRYQDSQREIARLAQEKATQQRELTHLSEALAMITARDAAKFELAGTPMAQKAHAMLAYDRKTGRAMLMVEGLPAAPADKAYQLWFIAGGKPMPGKVFTIDAEGKAMMDDDVPAAAREHAVFAVTLEPKSGVTAPTGQIYLASAAS
ncbi:MAG: hypothetical protein QOD75_1143 [Blastocatellia bacterium]|jgi:hypothetical protein|nr:hypothetical protein [Blastocatellia bacterium]